MDELMEGMGGWIDETDGSKDEMEQWINKMDELTDR